MTQCLTEVNRYSTLSIIWYKCCK